MSQDEVKGGSTRTKSKKKPKASQMVADEPIDETFDAMLDSASQSALGNTVNRTKQEGTGRWSNEMNIDDDNGEPSQMPTALHRLMRRPAEDIIATDIPTIQMEDGDMDEIPDAPEKIPDVPEFSIHQLATFKDMENEFSRERATQFIDPKIDIGILYQGLHLQEELDADDKKTWDWDKVFVEIRNGINDSMTN